MLFLFRQCWRDAVERGLLDEQDIELLEQDDDDNNGLDASQEGGDDDHHQHGAVRQQQLLAVVIVLSVVAVAVAYGDLFAFTFLCVLFTAIAALFVLFLPRLAFWLWTRRVDERFRQFVLALRQRELALFSLRHPPLSAADGSTFPLPFRTQRIRCLRQLCQFVHAFNGASTELVSTSGERDSLLFNFVSDEMRTLSSEEQTEPADDNDLHTNSLKSLWQYHFLVRSEFIRVALFALRRDLLCCRRLAFCRHLTLILNTVRSTASLRVDVGRSTTKTVTTKLTTNSTGYMSTRRRRLADGRLADADSPTCQLADVSTRRRSTRRWFDSPTVDSPIIVHTTFEFKKLDL